MIRISMVGGFAGLVAEFWYFKDYWQPPLILDKAKFSIEDFLFGFAITGIAATIYDVVYMKRNEGKVKERKKIFIFLFMLGLVLLLVFSNWLKINSIFVSSFAFIVFSIVMVMIRKDLLKPSFLSGLLTMIMILPIYLVIFNWILPDFWAKYWLLHNTKYGVMILKGVPATEVMWYFSWGCLAGIGYEFASGAKKIAKA